MYLVISEDKTWASTPISQDGRVTVMDLELASQPQHRYPYFNDNLFALYTGICRGILRADATPFSIRRLVGMEEGPQRAQEAVEKDEEPFSGIPGEGEHFCNSQGIALMYAHEEVPYAIYKQELGNSRAFPLGGEIREVPLVSRVTYEKYSEQEI